MIVRRGALNASRRSIRPELPARKAKAEATGKKPGGKPPQPPVEDPLPTHQIIASLGRRWVQAVLQRPGGGGGYSLLVVVIDLEQAAKEKQQLEPMLADSGYFSATNVTTYEAANIVPLIATRREVHHPS